MLHSMIEKPIVNKMSNEHFTNAQKEYIQSVVSCSDGALGAFCRSTNKLKSESTTRYDFLDTIRFMMLNFVCNKLDDEVIYQNTFAAWDDFVKHLPDAPKDKKLSFQFVKHLSLAGEDPLYSMVCIAHDEDLSPLEIKNKVINHDSLHFEYQLSTQQGSKLDKVDFEIKHDNFSDSFTKKTLVSPFY